MYDAYRWESQKPAEYAIGLCMRCSAKLILDNVLIPPEDFKICVKKGKCRQCANTKMVYSKCDDKEDEGKKQESTKRQEKQKSLDSNEIANRLNEIAKQIINKVAK